MAGIDTWDGEAFTSREFEDPGYDPGPPVSIRSLRIAARRRRRLWLTIAFAGLVLGASLHVILPSKINAVSKVYVVEPSNVDPATAIANDVNLLETKKVANQAATQLRLNPNQAVFNYKGSALGTSIISIKVTAKSAAAAKEENGAIAQAFLSVRNQIQNTLASNQVASLQATIGSLQADAREAAVSINALQGAGTSIKAGTSAQLTALNSQLSSDNEQVVALTGQIQDVKQSASQVTNYSVVLDPAYVVVPSKKKTAIKDGLSGLVAGLALGLGFVIAAELLSDRPRRRADVATALGAPVELSVGRLP